MLDTTKPERTVRFTCKFCNKRPWELLIPFGAFLDYDTSTGGSLIRAEIFEERQGIPDIFIKTVNCPTCGCISGSKLVNDI